MSKFEKYLKEQTHHHERRICKQCGSIHTCRCKAEKTNVYVDSCPECENGE